MLIRLLAPLLLLSLGGCANWFTQETDLSRLTELQIKGSVDDAQSITLPATADLVVQIRRFDRNGSPVVAEQRQSLDGRQLAIDFALALPAPANLITHHQLQALVVDRGVPLFASEPIVLNLSRHPVKTGAILLRPVQQVAFGRAYQCGSETLLFGELGGYPRLNARGQLFDLHGVKAPEGGTRYSAIGQPTTRLFWDHQRLIVAFADQRLPDCVALDEPPLPLTAGGQDPDWGLYASDDYLVLEEEDEESRTLANLGTDSAGERFVLRGAAPKDPLRVIITPRLCRDEESRLPHPYGVEVSSRRQQLRGCGGSPASLLLNRDWQVVQFDGLPPLRRARLSLDFGADGQLQGRGACNRYNAAWEISGKTLNISRLAATRMACPGPLQAQEQQFFDFLATVDGFDIDAGGGLILYSDERNLKARSAR